MDYCEDLETGDCLDSEYLDPAAPKATSARKDAFQVLTAALSRFGEDAVPCWMGIGDGGDQTIEWNTSYEYCVNVTCRDNGRYQLYVFDRVLHGHAWVPTTLVDTPHACLDDVLTALQGYVAVLADQAKTAGGVPAADLV